jgi:Acyl-CoA reductase (LuxC)
MPTDIVVPTVIRGELVDSDLIPIAGRGEAITFLTPDPSTLLDRLPLRDPSALADLQALSLDEILDYLVELGTLLEIERNQHMQLARELSYAVAPTTPPIVGHQYRVAPEMFRREVLEDMLAFGIDRAYLDGWVEHRLEDGRTLSVHAFGSRAIHISAGNASLVWALGIIRSALTRGDAILKSPSNDPFTPAAVARTMHELDPTHPVTRHVTTAYWRGGDEGVERHLYQPQNIEKIVAWGGFDSIKHIARYIQPGIELVSFDPKRSISIIDLASANAETLDDAALRLATDIGALNQNGCVNARVVYLICGSDESGLALANDFGERVYRAMLALPPQISTPPKGGIDRELRANLDAARLQDDYFNVIGGEHGEGAIVVSQLAAPVDFATLLADRVANLVPVDSLDRVLPQFDAYTQTVGVYPAALKATIRLQAGLRCAQRLVTLGNACTPSFAGPHDAMEPLRRLSRWVVDEDEASGDFRPSCVTTGAAASG